MSTADVEAGTGGLDSSIMFETDRDENRGNAFNNTYGHLYNFLTTRSSGSDLLALAVVGSMRMCNGYEVPLRVGRIDATEAGPSGVPEPQQDLETHTKIFAKQGFNQTEMIELVACGHTLGGVHHDVFPEIIGDNTTGEVSHFEAGESAYMFDNNVVTEYLSGNTTNPLVVASNATFHSDKRIFSLDNNKTMEALADATYFQERCQSLMGRMIDTVPKEVELSDPIEVVDVKPYVNSLVLNSNGSIDFNGYIRVRYGDDTGREEADLSAFITYTDRSGKNTTTPIEATRPQWQDGLGMGFRGYNFVYFEFTTQIDADAGISGFHIHLTTTSTNTTQVFDNTGNGFPVQDTVLYQLHQSCINWVQNDGVSHAEMTVAAAVRSEALSDSSALNLHFAKIVPQQGALLGRFENQIEPFVATGEKLAGYELFKVDKMYVSAASGSTTFDVVLGGEKEARVDFQYTNSLSEETCKPLIE